MEALVKSCSICWVWSASPGMLNVLQNNKFQIYLGKVELFCYLLQGHCYHVVLNRYGPA